MGTLGLKTGESGQGWQIRRRGGEQRMILTMRGPGGDDTMPAEVNPTVWTHIAGVFGGVNGNCLSMAN